MPIYIIMTLESVVYHQQDPFNFSNYACKDSYTMEDNFINHPHEPKVHFDQGGSFNVDSNSNASDNNMKSNYSPPYDDVCSTGIFAGAYPALESLPTAARRKRRRMKNTKNKEEVESQRMTHIVVERNRRKQMNDYLALLRSMMPASYAQRVRTYLKF